MTPHDLKMFNPLFPVDNLMHMDDYYYNQLCFTCCIVLISCLIMTTMLRFERTNHTATKNKETILDWWWEEMMEEELKQSDLLWIQNSWLWISCRRFLWLLANSISKDIFNIRQLCILIHSSILWKYFVVRIFT